MKSQESDRLPILQISEERINRLVHECILRIPQTVVSKVYLIKSEIAVSDNPDGAGLALRYKGRNLIFLFTFYLNRLSDSAVLGAVAHELAHVAAGHVQRPFPHWSGWPSKEQDEAEADGLVRRWGLSEEIKATRSELGWG